jgi:mercuric ion transport protein
MKSALGAVVAAVAASTCCLGPVVFTAIGSGVLAAASTKVATVRAIFLVLTAVLLGFAYRTYRAADASATCRDGTCAPGTNHRARVVFWITAAIVVLFAGFPYYAEYLF